MEKDKQSSNGTRMAKMNQNIENYSVLCLLTSLALQRTCVHAHVCFKLTTVSHFLGGSDRKGEEGEAKEGQRRGGGMLEMLLRQGLISGIPLARQDVRSSINSR